MVNFLACGNIAAVIKRSELCKLQLWSVTRPVPLLSFAWLPAAVRDLSWRSCHAGWPDPAYSTHKKRYTPTTISIFQEKKVRME